MQGGAEAGAARAEDEDVALERVDHGTRSASSSARPSGAVQSRLPIARAISRPSRPTTKTIGECVTCHAPFTPPATSRSTRSEEHTSELQSRLHLVCRLLLEKKKKTTTTHTT